MKSHWRPSTWKSKDLKSQANNQQTTISELKAVITNYKTTMDLLLQENAVLRTDNEISREKFNELEYTRDNLEQDTLKHNMIINGVTEIQGENTLQVVCQFCGST